MSFEVIRLPDTALALEGGDLAEFFDTLDGPLSFPSMTSTSCLLRWTV
jgi:hypothetical protein